MNSTILKGLLATVFMFVLATIQASGFPVTTVGWEVLGITTLGTVLVYVGQSMWLVTTSVAGAINWKDIIKGAVIMIGNSFATVAAATLTGTLVDVKTLLYGLGAILVVYISKQFAVKPPKA